MSRIAIATTTVEHPLSTINTKTEPSTIESLAALLLAFGIQICEYLRHSAVDGSKIWGDQWYDAGDYIRIAQIIGHKTLAPNSYYSSNHYFFGTSLAIAFLAKLLSIPEATAIVGLSMSASLCVCALICRLYGSSVAFVFAIVSLEWLKASVVGASEPLFVALFLGALLSARGEWWVSASLLAALATTVRPVGVFALLGLGLVLLGRKQFAELAGAVSIAAIVAAAYLWFAHRMTGDAFINFKLYGVEDWNSVWPITIPFAMVVASFKNTVVSTNAWFRVFHDFGYLSLTLAISIAALTRDRLRLFRTQPVEATTAMLYLSFLLCYNYAGIGYYWARFILPILPIVLYGVKDWLPRSRLVLWPCIITSSFLAVIELVGFKTVFGFSILHR